MEGLLNHWYLIVPAIWLAVSVIAALVMRSFGDPAPALVIGFLIAFPIAGLWVLVRFDVFNLQSRLPAEVFQGARWTIFGLAALGFLVLIVPGVTLTSARLVRALSLRFASGFRAARFALSDLVRPISQLDRRQLVGVVLSPSAAERRANAAWARLCELKLDRAATERLANRIATARPGDSYRQSRHVPDVHELLVSHSDRNAARQVLDNGILSGDWLLRALQEWRHGDAELQERFDRTLQDRLASASVAEALSLLRRYGCPPTFRSSVAAKIEQGLLALVARKLNEEGVNDLVGCASIVKEVAPSISIPTWRAVLGLPQTLTFSTVIGRTYHSGTEIMTGGADTGFSTGGYWDDDVWSRDVSIVPLHQIGAAIPDVEVKLRFDGPKLVR